MNLRLAAAVLVALASPLLWIGCGGSSESDACVPTTESCNGVDDDCDGEVDEPGATGCTLYFVDADSDGYGGPSACLCAPSAPYTLTVGGDCDDAAPNVFPSATELCNGIDDDCDAQTDEGIVGCCAPATEQPCGVAQGVCTVGTATCGVDFAWGQCLDGTGTPVILPGTLAEVCDGLDNDCDPDSADGADDAQLGVACDGPDTDLCEEGTYSCVLGALACSDNTGSQVDVCDGIDNDCDPSSADGSEDPQLGAACDGPDSDLCKEGTYSCVLGALACSDNTGSQLDLCDGLDNDCDPSSADGSEDPQLGAACDGPDSDLCKEGTYSCVLGALACSDNTGGQVELCDGVDNDCDGQTDEGYLGLGAPCARGAGLCLREGILVCSADGSAVECSVVAGPPAAENCNGLDDDCDGVADESLVQGCYTGPFETQGVGACAAGTSTCAFGAWGGCDGQILPVAESCDGVDNDCDGETDEGFAVGAACVVGEGACAVAAVTVCSPDRTTVICGALPAAPGGETCNRIDDDCDGWIDDGLTGCCTPAETKPCGVAQGVCAAGTTTCGSDGAWKPCIDSGGTPVTLPGTLPEFCDGVDNDCDGRVDEQGATDCANFWIDADGDGFGGGSPLCLCDRTGPYTTQTGGDCDDDHSSAAPGGYEVCDGLDNDCNGLIDDLPANLGACDGSDSDLCADGVNSCVGGVMVCVDDPADRDDLCGNGLDDDCDGQTDEGCP